MACGVLSGVESWLNPVSTGVSILIVTTPASSQRAIARWVGKSSGIGLVETSIAIAVPGAISPASGARPIAQSSVNICSCTRAHPAAASASIEMSNNLRPKNLTPGPFPSGKGSKMRSGLVPFGKGLLPTIRFPLGKRLLPIRFPFPLGKGLGVRFFVSTLFTGACACPLIRIAAILAIVVKNLEPLLTQDVLFECEARRQPGTERAPRLLRIRQLRPRIQRRQRDHPRPLNRTRRQYRCRRRVDMRLKRRHASHREQINRQYRHQQSYCFFEHLLLHPRRRSLIGR